MDNRLTQPVPRGVIVRPPRQAASQPAAAPQPPMSPAVPPAATAAAAATTETDESSQTPAVTIEWRRASEISVGREFNCELIVRNQGAAAARDIELTAVIPPNVRLTGAEPRPSQTEGHLGWRIDELAAGGELVYTLTMVPEKAGEIATQAQVRFTESASSRFEVSQPMLALKLEGPDHVLIGEAATQIITVSNPGTGIAENVQIEALIPAGLEHVRGSRLLMDIGPLHPGEARSIRLPLAAVAGGMQTVQVQTRADLDLAEIAAANIAVIAPELVASIHGPGLRYVGRRATYTLAVRNEGDVATNNVQVMHKVPEGFELVGAHPDVQYDENQRLATWYVGSLDSGQAAQVELTFDCEQIGDFTHYIRATSEHGVISDTSVHTKVEGISSLAMEIQDLEDPVEVGTETVYEIRVKNEGSAAASDISISCELPHGVNLVNVTGPVQYVAENDLIVFRPIQTLAPNATATFKVHVASAVAGNLRFRARLSSASIEEPLIKEELTRFYGDAE